MKHLLFSIAFLCIYSISFSQESTKQLTDFEKYLMRKNNSSKIAINSKKDINTNTLKMTNSIEQNINEVKTTTVKYYYGKQDSLYKEFEYTSKQ